MPVNRRSTRVKRWLMSEAMMMLVNQEFAWSCSPARPAEPLGFDAEFNAQSRTSSQAGPAYAGFW